MEDLVVLERSEEEDLFITILDWSGSETARFGAKATSLVSESLVQIQAQTFIHPRNMRLVAFEGFDSPGQIIEAEHRWSFYPISNPFLSVTMTIIEAPREFDAYTDQEALVALQCACGSALDKWGSNYPLSSWKGVIVGENGRVVALNLSHCGLTGDLPAELGNLTMLETLDLESNELTGPIPSSIGNLKALDTLYLSSNHFTGQIPPELGQLTSLFFLWLSDNNLSGSVPRELSNLSALKQIWLHSNPMLTGCPAAQIPNEETQAFICGQLSP